MKNRIMSINFTLMLVMSIALVFPGPALSGTAAEIDGEVGDLQGGFEDGGGQRHKVTRAALRRCSARKTQCFPT